MNKFQVGDKVRIRADENHSLYYKTVRVKDILSFRGITFITVTADSNYTYQFFPEELELVKEENSMKAAITPPVDREVTITMTESQAQLLKRVCNWNYPHRFTAWEDNGLNATKVADLFGNIYSALTLGHI